MRITTTAFDPDNKATPKIICLDDNGEGPGFGGLWFRSRGGLRHNHLATVSTLPPTPPRYCRGMHAGAGMSYDTHFAAWNLGTRQDARDGEVFFYNFWWARATATTLHTTVPLGHAPSIGNDESQ